MRFAVITLASIVGFGAVWAPEAGAQSASTNTAAQPALPAPSTADFIAKVAAGNTFEIESSQLALRKSGSEKVKTFANQMVNDHTLAGRKFKQAVTEAKVPSPPEAMDAKHQALVDDLGKKDMNAFDKPYIDAQRTAHLETVALFDAYAMEGDNPRLKQFAQELLPTLRGHLDHVSKLQ